MKVTHNVRQVARGELAASTGSVAELCQPNSVTCVLVVMHVVSPPFILGIGLQYWPTGSAPRRFPELEIDHQLICDVFECRPEAVAVEARRNPQRRSRGEE